MWTTASSRATGKYLSQKDGEALRKLVEIIIAENGIARTRTKFISIYLKFAVEDLRRRRYAEKAKGKSKKPFEPGKTEIAETATDRVESLDDIMRNQKVAHFTCNRSVS
jgi:hypothetical protein